MTNFIDVGCHSRARSRCLPCFRRAVPLLAAAALLVGCNKTWGSLSDPPTAQTEAHADGDASAKPKPKPKPEPEPEPEPDATGPDGETPDANEPPASPRDRYEVMADEARIAITRFSPDNYRIKHAFLRELRFHRRFLTWGVNLHPNMRNGTMQGYKLLTVKPDTFWALLGLARGDVLRDINGVALDQRVRVDEAFHRAGLTFNYTITYERHGRSRTLSLKAR